MVISRRQFVSINLLGAIATLFIGYLIYQDSGIAYEGITTSAIQEIGHAKKPDDIKEAHGMKVWAAEMLENEAPDAVVFCLSRTGGRLRCNQIISQGCSGFKGIV